MDSMVFKYKHHHHQQYQQQQQQQQQHFTSSTSNYHNNSSNNHNNNNQNSIFILNTATNNLFNCSSNSLKLNHGNHSGIEAKPFKSKSELLKKKTKFWKYLEGEANDKNNQRGIEEANNEDNYKKLEGKSLKTKSKYWSKSGESDNQNPTDLSELLEYSCSLCDNCRCMDCQIGYFDCENSDDSNSEYSFHLSAYDEEEHNEAVVNPENCESDNEREVMELKTDCELESSNDMCCNKLDNAAQFEDKLPIDSKLATNCSVEYCDVNCDKVQCCQQCWLESVANDQSNILATQRDH